MKRLFSVGCAVLAMTALLATPAIASHQGGGDRNCDDFTTQPQAQRYFDNHGGSRTDNVDGLDADGDGMACDGLPIRGGGRRKEDSRVVTGVPDTSTHSAALGDHRGEMPWFVLLLGGGMAGIVFRWRLAGSRSRRTACPEG